MLPPIDLLLSAELMRDGGSLAARFQCADGSTYSLFFKLDQFVNRNRDHERGGYFSPVVMNWVYGIEISISWPHAEIPLGQMLTMAPSDDDRKWLEAMLEVVANRGGLPSSISRIVGAVRL